MIRSVCITGAGGFLGSRLCGHFSRLGVEVEPVDIRNHSDLLDERVSSRIRPVDCIVHLAANTYVPDSHAHPEKFLRVNYLLTLSALELCRRSGARFIYFSSYVYGRPRYLPVDENHPVDGFNPYACSKLIGEELCRAYQRHFNVRLSIVRPFNIYGPGQDDRFLIPKIVKMAREGNVLLENPDPRRDFLHVDDVMTFMEKLVGYGDGPDADVFNLGSGIDYSVDEIARMVQDELHFTLNYEHRTRPEEILLTRCDISKAGRILRWNPTVTMKDGLRRLIHGG
jgi:nucleoside-diphosphate-sugar epimerase